MLDDLDLLAQRIRELAAQMQAQAQTIADLNQSLSHLRQERDDLSLRVQNQAVKLSEAQSSLGATQTKVQEVISQAKAEQAQLQGTLDLFRQEHQSLQIQAQASASEVGRLKHINQSAQQRIEKVLEQLPGSPTSESV